MGDNAYKKRHKELGLCTFCSKPSIPFSTLCLTHTLSQKNSVDSWRARNKESVRRKDRESKQHYRDTNRCPSCGAPLVETGFITCMNCRQIKTIPKTTNKY